jgi:hypothetical protein
MSQSSIVTSSGRFIMKNILWILIVVVLLIALTVYIAANNITFEKQKSTLEKVIVIEKNTPRDLSNVSSDAQAASSTPEICKKFDNKSACTSLGSCVWATAKDGANQINKCVVAATLGMGSTHARGSDGPTDLCYCSDKGKLIQWDKYYYLDGGSVKEKAGRICMAIGGTCTK